MMVIVPLQSIAAIIGAFHLWYISGRRNYNSIGVGDMDALIWPLLVLGNRVFARLNSKLQISTSRGTILNQMQIFRISLSLQNLVLWIQMSLWKSIW